MSRLDLFFARPPTPPPPPAPQPPPSGSATVSARPTPDSAGGVAPPPAPAPTQAAPRGSAIPASPGGTPAAAPAVRVEFGQPAENAGRARAIDMQRRWTLAAVLGAIGKAPGPEAILAKADQPGPVEPGSLLEAVKAMRASIPAAD